MLSEGEIKLNINGYLERIASGDLSCLESLYDLTADGLYRAAYSCLKNREDAQDVLSEVYGDIQHIATKYERGKSGKNYLITTVKNRSVDKLRQRQIRIKYDKIISVEVLRKQAVAEDRAELMTLLSACEKLDEEEYGVIFYTYWGGLPIRDVAKAMNCTSARAYRLLVKAKKTLRAEIEAK